MDAEHYAVLGRFSFIHNYAFYEDYYSTQYNLDVRAFDQVFCRA